MIINIIKKLFYDPYKFVNKYKKNILIGNSKLLKSFVVEFHKKRDDLCLEIGNNCVLQNIIIFEKDTGKVTIGNNTWINASSKIISIDEVEIGSNVTIAWDVTIYDHDGTAIDMLQRQKNHKISIESFNMNDYINEFDWTGIESKKITIKDNVWIGFGVTILKGVTIGEGAVIGAKAVVTKDVPAYCVAAGNPAKVVKEIKQ